MFWDVRSLPWASCRPPLATTLCAVPEGNRRTHPSGHRPMRGPDRYGHTRSVAPLQRAVNTFGTGDVLVAGRPELGLGWQTEEGGDKAVPMRGRGSWRGAVGTKLQRQVSSDWQGLEGQEKGFERLVSKGRSVGRNRPVPGLRKRPRDEVGRATPCGPAPCPDCPQTEVTRQRSASDPRHVRSA